MPALVAMKDLNPRNITMMAAVAASFTQIGAQLFALSVIARTVSSAPPRSFAILEGAYRYDSSAFWETVPPITFLIFVVALITNWKTARRNLMLLALGLFIVGGIVAGFFLEPVFDEMKAIGFRDEVDPILQARAATWYALDWAVWFVGLTGGLALLLAFLRPASTAEKEE